MANTPSKTNGRVNRLIHRQNVPWRVYDAINRRNCLHIDAWCVQDRDNTLYFVIEERVGGHDVLSARIWRVDNRKELVRVGEGVRNTTYALNICIKRHVDSPWAKRNAPWLDAIHREIIQPQLRLPRVGFKAPHSIALHYVWTNPAIDDPMEGLPNYHPLAPARSPMPSDDADTAQRLPPRERSILRTLDKLLR